MEIIRLFNLRSVNLWLDSKLVEQPTTDIISFLLAQHQYPNKGAI